jgi:bacteriocin biosynthesis cyclodehydratase domain-containing protein
MAWEIACYLTGAQRPTTVDGLVQVDLDTWRTRHFELARDDECASCALATPAARPVGERRPSSDSSGRPSEPAPAPRGGPSIASDELLLRWQPRVVRAADAAGCLHVVDLRDRHFKLRGLTPAQLHACELLDRPTPVADLVARAPGPVRRLLDGLNGRGLLQVLAPDGEAGDPRYARQLAYFGMLEDDVGGRHRVQERLRCATVAVVGVGGVGNWVAQHLAAMGIGTLILVDGDVVERSNLNRQLLYSERDLGAPKVEAARRELTALNPEVAVRPIVRTVASAGELESVVAGADLFVIAADKPPVLLRRWASVAARRFGVPWVSGGVDAYLLQLGPLYVPEETACYHCRELRAGDGPSSHLRAAWMSSRTAAPLVAPACAMVATAMALEVVRHLGRLGTSALKGRYVTLDMRSWRSSSVELQRHPGCPVCGGLSAAS